MLLHITVHTKICLFENKTLSPFHVIFLCSVHVSVLYSICLSSMRRCIIILQIRYFCISVCYYVLMYPLHMYVLISSAYVTCMGVQCDCSSSYIFSVGACAAVCCKVQLRLEPWSCMCQCMYHSYASYSYWVYKCVPCSSFLSLWHPRYALYDVYRIILHCCCGKAVQCLLTQQVSM
jgi:hypothetical protein